MAYLGAPVFREDFIAKPCQSLIAQSRHRREPVSPIMTGSPANQMNLIRRWSSSGHLGSAKVCAFPT
ncbi:hypothetical protein ACE10Z_01060 [Bradyrhizobium sp. Pha-3]|uniref:hypothetical protein n=1 Tax=Bradyrhizobium sp. Pha-3 TaxID=208375 RepID=UPI0035D46E3E